MNQYPKHLIWKISLLALLLGGLLLPGQQTLAAFSGPEFLIEPASSLVHSTDSITYDSFSGNFLLGYSSQLYTGGWVQPHIAAVDANGLVSMLKLADTTQNVVGVSVACSGVGDCLAVWAHSQHVYAQRFSSDLTLIGTPWTVDTDGDVFSAMVVYGDTSYVVAWDHHNNNYLRMRYVSNTGPYGTPAYVTPPTGCTKIQLTDLDYFAGGDAHRVLVAYDCFEGGSYLHGRNYLDNLKQLWTIILGQQALASDGGATVAISNTDFLVAWNQSGVIRGQRYDGMGYFVGDEFTIYPGNVYGDLAYNADKAEYLYVFQDANRVYYQRVKDAIPTPERLGEAYAVSTTAPYGQTLPLVAYGSGMSRFLAVWTNYVDIEPMSWTSLARFITLESVLEPTTPQAGEGTSGSDTPYQMPVQSGPWQAVAIWPASGDSDLLLFDSPEFTNLMGSSISGAGEVEMMVLNSSQGSLPGALFPLVQHISGDSYHAIESSPRADRFTQDHNNGWVYLDYNSVVRMFEVIAATDQPLSIQISPDAGMDIGVALFDPTYGPYQNLSLAAAVANSNGAGQPESLYFAPAHGGSFGLLLWKGDGSTGGVTINVGGAALLGTTIYLPMIQR